MLNVIVFVDIENVMKLSLKYILQNIMLSKGYLYVKCTTIIVLSFNPFPLLNVRYTIHSGIHASHHNYR